MVCFIDLVLCLTACERSALDLLALATAILWITWTNATDLCYIKLMLSEFVDWS